MWLHIWTKCNLRLFLTLIMVFVIGSIYYQFTQKSLLFRYFGKAQSCQGSQLDNYSPLSRKGSQPTQTDLQIRRFMSEIDRLVPNVTFSHKDNTTCALKSRAFIVKPRDRYCIGDKVTVQLDMYDYLGHRKTYGGDALRTRIYSPGVKAAASGSIQDFNNGTYHVHFMLFWEAKVRISLLLIHPSEGASALWRARNMGYKYVTHKGKFTSATQEVITQCGFELDSKEEVCEYLDERDEEAFYCVKPTQLPCGSLTELASLRTELTYLSNLELQLFDRPNLRVEIPHTIQDIEVFNCTDHGTTPKPKCEIGMWPPFPGGFVLQDIWTPVSCSMKRFRTPEEINSCLKGKTIYFMGDSTVKQWMNFLTDTVKTLKELDLYEGGWQKMLMAVDVDRNIQIRYKKHGNPFACGFYSVREDRTIPRQIDQVGGNEHTVIALSLGAHFRAFPMHLFIRRAINIRRAIERLFLRSPETRVVIKTENTSDMERDFEKLSDFHGFVQYSILNSIFRGLNVGVVDAWDITTAFASNNMHPSPTVIENEINLFLTLIC
ncbi:NXPE family member 4-like isoform X2 [Pleurodeles waltl]